MENIDTMPVIFRDPVQEQRYAMLSQRPMLLTRYPNSSCMEALGIEPSVSHLCNQLQWDEYTDVMHVTYRNLTLEFLSSLTYEPYVGHTSDGGYINFRLFRAE